MRIYLGHFCKADKERELGISVAASNFSNTLVSGDIFDRVYSILPPFVTGKRNANELATENSVLLYSALRRLPAPLSRVAPIFEQLALFFKIPRGASLWLYNVTMLNWILIKLLKWLKPSVKIYPIVLDYTPGLPGNDKFLKAINNSAGRISLTNYSELSKVNFHCLPGITPLINTHPQIKSPKPTFLLSGVLSEEISSISTVVEAFANVPEATLYITGNLSHNPALIERIAHIRNINYLGMLSKAEYNNLLDTSTTFILSTRNPNFPENQCNFPSKIIEGLSHNRGVISTISYPQIDGINYITTKLSVEELRNTIRNVSSMTASQIERYINQGEKVAKMFSISVWKSIIEKIEKPYDFVYLTNTPSFYKLNLCQEISKRKCKILVVFNGYGREAVNRHLNDDTNWGFDWHFLYNGDYWKRPKRKTFQRLCKLLKSIYFKKILFSGWMSTEYNIYCFLSPRHKNIIICESSIFEAKINGVKGFIKRRIISRMNSGLPSGTPHSKLLQLLGMPANRLFHTGSVGLFQMDNKTGNFLTKERTSRVKGGNVRFLYVGRLTDVKNLKVLVKCFNRNGYNLTIVGHGEQDEKLKALSRPNISFTGFVDNDELGSIYRQHDIFILPSKSEPWGLVVEESLYRGIPVIVSDMVGSGPDLVLNTGSGISFKHDSVDDLQNAIDLIIRNYDKYAFAASAIDFEKRKELQIMAYLTAINL